MRGGERVSYDADLMSRSDYWADIARTDGGIHFFFSSRRRHTRYWRDWSSDVCSSDLQDDRPLWRDGSSHLTHEPGKGPARRPSGILERPIRFGYASRLHAARPAGDRASQIGRASCRERVRIAEGACAAKNSYTRRSES